MTDETPTPSVSGSHNGNWQVRNEAEFHYEGKDTVGLVLLFVLALALLIGLLHSERRNRTLMQAMSERN